MWQSKGRSGIGDTNIQGTWEDWDGLSPNGRQYKNAITQETRDLSGADYWHARKANNESQLPSVWINGRANVAAFKDDSTEDKHCIDRHTPVVLPGQETLDSLDNLEISLYRDYRNGRISKHDYEQRLLNTSRKRNNAWGAYMQLCKGWWENRQTSI